MAVLTLTKVWLNLAETGDAVSAYSSGRSETSALDGEVKIFASGRKRSFTSVGDRRDMKLTLRDISDADLETLRLWRGQTVLLRDHFGRKIFGTFYSVDVHDRKTIGLYDVSLTVQEVSYTEGV